MIRIVGPHTCLAGIVDASKNSANANALARRIADDSRNTDCPNEIEVTTE